MATLVGLPEGFVLDAAVAGPALPEGFVVDATPSTSAVDARLAAEFGQQQDVPLFDRIGQRLSERHRQGVDISSAEALGEQGAAESFFQTGGKVIAGGALDVTGEFISSGLDVAGDVVSAITPDFIEDPIKEGAAATLKFVLESEIGQAGLEALSSGVEAYAEFKAENPRAARNIESVLNVGLLAAEVTGASALTKVPIKEIASKVPELASKVPELASKVPIKKIASFIPQILDQAARPGATDKAILSELAKEGLTPELAITKLRQLGPEGMLADVGEGGGLARLARVGQTEGAAFIPAAKRAIFQRAQQSGERVVKFVNNLTGTKKNFFTSLEEIDKRQKAEAGVLFKKAFEAKAVSDDTRLKQFLDDPIAKEGLRTGLKIERLEAIAEGRPFNAFDFSVVDFNEAGDPILGEVINMRVLNAVKKGIDNTIEGFRSDVTGKLNLTELGRAINKFQRSFIKRIDKLNPDYKIAREAYAGPARQKNAMQAGRDFMKGDPEIVEQFTARLTVDEKASFMEGVSRSIQDMVDKNMNASAVVNQLLKKPKFRKSMKIVFDNNKQELEFISFLRNEAKFNATKNTVFGGSDTAAKLSDAERFFKGSDLADAAINIASGRPSGVIASLARKIGSLKGRVPKRQLDELRVLLTTDQDAVVKKLRELSKILKKTAL